MTENRDFLKEMEELRVETDGIRDALVSKTGHFQNLLSDSGTLKVIMSELKEMRKEIKEGKEENEKKLEEMRKQNQELQQKIEQQIEEGKELKKDFAEQIRKEIKVIDEKNDKKLEELKKELKKEIARQNLENEKKLSELKNDILKLSEKVDKPKENQIVPKNDAETDPKEIRVENQKKFEELTKQFVEQNLKIQRNIKENEKKLSELSNEILKQLEKIDATKESPVAPEESTESARKIPIREAVLGEWKMVQYESWRYCDEASSSKRILEHFSGNLKFELVDGKMKRSGGGDKERIEGDDNAGTKLLYVEGDHLKSHWSTGTSDDLYIENGKLHFDVNWDGDWWKRVYKKI